MMGDFAVGVSLIVVGMFIGLTIGLFISADVSLMYKKEAFDRGFMVQCVGKTGYYWECK